jgi:hypothetical protein
MSVSLPDLPAFRLPVSGNENGLDGIGNGSLNDIGNGYDFGRGVDDDRPASLDPRSLTELLPSMSDRGLDRDLPGDLKAVR